jgi:hypothetical protein
MKHRLYIEYDVVSGDISIVENDMTALESFGAIEAAKHMIAQRWLEKTEGVDLE